MVYGEAIIAILIQLISVIKRGVVAGVLCCGVLSDNSLRVSRNVYT